MQFEMLKCAVGFVGLFLLSISAYSQNYLGNNSGAGIDMNTHPYGIVDEIAMAPPSTEGSYFLHNEYRIGEIELLDGRRLINIPINYDVNKNLLFFLLKDIERTLNSSSVKSFAFYKFGSNTIKTKFINSRLLGLGYEKHFYKALFQGERWSLYSLISSEFIRSSYNKALDMNSDENKIVKKETIFLSNGNELIEVPNGKRKRMELIESINKSVAERVINNRIKIKSQEGLEVAVKYLNDNHTNSN